MKSFITRLGFFIIFPLAACKPSAPKPELEPHETAGVYDIQPVSEPQLARDITEVCQTASEHKQPVLIEFSAEWCPDCRALKKLFVAPPVAKAKSAFAHYTINVGQFDRHKTLLEAFAVHKIATLVTLSPPEDCTLPLESWSRTGADIFEPTKGGVTVDSLSTWLSAQAHPPVNET